jgi:predicted NAD/FAD-dependent oxidoreductase
MLAASTSAQPARAAIVAVGPHQLRGTFAPEMLAAQPALGAFLDQMQTLTYEPIVTIWLGYGAATRLPAPITRLDDAPGQWVVDRPDIVARAPAATDGPRVAQVLAVIVSATGPHGELDANALAHAADAQLRRLQPALPARIWFQVITEKRATYACTPRRVRPAGPRLAHGIYLAGDYVDAEFPATLEAAVRSGVAAAEALLADLGRTR